MTICIAGIAEGKKIIAITDKMLTLNAPVATKFEVNENNKAIQLSDKVVSLFAGDVIQANEILQIALIKIQSDLAGHQTVLDVANSVVSAYRDYWKRIITDNLLNRFGVTLEVFMGNHRNLDPDLVKNINKVLTEFNLAVEIIVAGIDVAPHVYCIRSPGTLISYDSLGYCSVGSGSQHATLSLIESEYSGAISEARGLHALLEAKKRAEYDPGVGELCDIVLINDSYKKLNSSQIVSIDDRYKQSFADIRGSKDKCANDLLKIANK